MINRRSFSIIVNLLLMASLVFPIVSLAADQTVTAIGRADIIGNNKDAARTKALANAFRDAVEKGLGVWIQSNTEVKEAMLVKDQILTKAEGYVIDHEIVKESVENDVLSVTIKATVSIDRIGADFKTLVGRVSTEMGNPSITFVLTTWEKRGSTGSSSNSSAIDSSVREDAKSKYDQGDAARAKSDSSASLNVNEKAAIDSRVSTAERASINAQGSGSYSETGSHSDNSSDYSGSGNISASGNSTYNGTEKAKASASYDGSAQASSAQETSSQQKGWSNTSKDIDSNVKSKTDISFTQISEDLWVKYPNSTIIDSFNQEFKEKRFNIVATDTAMEIANSKSLTSTSVNPFDRKLVREAAEKEGANYVARGEVQILDTTISESTGNTEVTAQIGVQIIDVGSGDIVASYANTATASSSKPMEAQVQAVKKAAVLAARTLAGQTIDTWQDRSLNGRTYTIEVRKITSKRSQERPILNAIESLAQITASTNPEKDVLLVKVMYKGEKKKLEDGLLDALGSKPGFSEKEFDGPETIEGKIVFTFK